MKSMRRSIVVFCGLLFGFSLLQAEGLIVDTLVSAQHGFVPIQSIVVDDTMRDGNSITHAAKRIADCCVEIYVGDCVVCAAQDQKFYVANVQQWVNTEDLIVSDLLLCRGGKSVCVEAIYSVSKSCIMHALSVETSHVFYVTPYEIIVHNMEPTGGAAIAFLSVMCPPAGAALAVVEAVALGVVGIGVYCAYKKQQKKKKMAENLKEASKSSSVGGGGKDPKDEDDKNNVEKYPHGIYEDAPYHTSYGNSIKGPRPKNGQAALNNSVSLGRFSTGRVGVSDGEIVILRQTSERIYHGYVETWSNLLGRGSGNQAIRNALTRNKLVTQAGKIINSMII